MSKSTQEEITEYIETFPNYPQYLREHGQAIFDNGYSILPIVPGEKAPGVTNWTNLNFNQTLLNVWLKTEYFQDFGLGIVTKNTPAIDIDIEDPEIVEKVINWCDKNIGRTISRVGSAPRTLLVFRTDTPFKKYVSKKYIDFTGQEQKLEILCDGQQFVAFHIHPDERTPYKWSPMSVLNTKREELPELTEDKVKALLDYFESIVPDDWQVVAGRDNGDRDRERYKDIELEDMALARATPKPDFTDKQVLTALSILDPDMGRDDWVRVGMGLYHHFDGAHEAYEAFCEWSSGSLKYKEGEMSKVWNSFNVDLSRATPTTAATVIKMAKEAYAKKKTEKKIQKEVQSGFPFVAANDMASKLGPIDWQVKNYLEADTVGILFGDPGSYKSFIAMDIGLHVALGRDWHGNSVKQGPVFYIAGEGHGGFARRLTAFKNHHGVSLNNVPFFFSERAASFHEDECAELVSDEIKLVADTVGEPSLVIIDTLARNFGAGDENSTKDMGVFIDNVVEFIRQRFSASVLLVHHTGHGNKERARGSMALKGALDFEYRLERPEDASNYMIKMTCTKMKDAVEPSETWFKGREIVVGNFEDEDMTSLIFEKSEAPTESDVQLKGKQKDTFELLKSLIEDEKSGFSKSEFINEMVVEGIATSKRSARDSVRVLVRKGVFIEENDFIYVNSFEDDENEGF